MKLPIDPKLALSQTQTLPGKTAAKREDPEALREKCQQFEAIFIQTLFKGMRSTVPKGELLGGGSGEELFQELKDMELAQQMSKTQGLGIGEALFRQLQGKPEEE